MQENPLSAPIQAWCQAHLQATDGKISRVSPLRVEASHRQFFRLHTANRTLVLMLSPPHLERNKAFHTLSALLHEQGMPVPRIVAHQEHEGWFMMNDLGDVHLEQIYATPDKHRAIQAAIELLPRLTAIQSPALEGYSGARMDMEVRLFTEWFVGGLLKSKDPTQHASTRDVYNTAYAELVTAMLAQPRGCVHFDYHCRNILFDMAQGQLGIVDFQDARHGPVMYDPASLLRDCYFAFSEAEVNQWLSYYRELQPLLAGHSADQVRYWFDMTAIQRQLKAVGIFARLYLRDGRASHLPTISPVLARLSAQCGEHSQLQPFLMQLNSCIEKWSEISTMLNTDTAESHS